ncbi:MAG: hypothetical protein V3S06_01320 [candidate division Zixibacteria bacterium]
MLKRKSGPSYMFSFAFVLVVVIASTASAQLLYDPLVVYESFTENGVLPGARAAAMGGAQIAAGMDGSALWYNPALLTRIRHSEISGTLTHQIFSNKTSLLAGARQETDVSNTRLGSLWGIFPVPTYRGGLTLGISVNRIRNFDRIFRYASSNTWLGDPTGSDGWGGGEDENGSLRVWSLGGAVEISPKTSIGLSLDIYDGDDSWTFFFDSTSISDNYRYSYQHTIADDYTGISGKVGITYTVNNHLNLSGVINFPTSITIDQTSDIFEFDNQGLDEADYSSSSYKYTLPFGFDAGAAFRYEDLTIAGDIGYTDYTQLEYRSGLFDLPGLNQTVKKYYNDIFTYHVGAEYLIRPAGVRLRAGYYQDPIAFTGFPIETEPHYFTFGAGFIIDRSINIDLAYLTGSWERDDPSISSSEKYNVQRFMVTISYRM